MKAGLWRSGTITDGQKMGPSIRGRISNPIPIPNAGNEDFSSRNPRSSPPTPHALDDGDPISHRSLRSPRHHHTATASSSLLQAGPAPVSGNDSDVAHSGNSGSNNSLPAAPAPAGPSGPSPPSGFARDSPQGKMRTNQFSQIRYSVVSTSSQRTGGTGNREPPQRKKSTIRGALSKLFGRRKKAKSQGSTIPENSSGTTSVQYRSGLSTLSRVANDGQAKRSTSLPITEYDRALRSHSVGPGDITAIESARNSFHTDYNFTRRRAATTSTQLQPLVRVRDGELAGLSPRPASTHARSSRILDNPDEIGKAITSDLNGLRRRSRSLSGLGDIGGINHGALRRRSDDIRYWRESYDPGFASPLSSNVPEADDTVSVAADTPVDAAPSESRKSPPEPFNLASLATVNAMAGMRITHAANLDNRLGALEARMRRIEILVNRVRNAVPEPESPVFGRAPARSVRTVSDATLMYMGSSAPTDPPFYRTTSRDEATTVAYSNSRPSVDTQSSFDEASTFRGSLHPPPGNHTRRPISNSTIRGAASLPALSREVNDPLSTDHYTTLLALLETERSTRRSLEDQVRRLSHTVDLLTKRARTGMLLEPPPTARSFGGQSAFDDDDTDEGNDESGRNTPKKRSPNLEDSGIAAGLEDTDDENPREPLTTPREERALGFGAFGEELRDDDEDGNRKKAARTLSLSQLTVAKGQKRF